MTKEEYTHQAERQDSKAEMKQVIFGVMGSYLAESQTTPLTPLEVSEVLKSCLLAVTPN